MATEITVDVKLDMKVSMWDCLKMRVLGFTKNAIFDYIDHIESKQYERNLLQNINDGILTTESIVNELSKREGVKELIVTPHQPYVICVGTKVDGESYHPTHEETGPARILVVID